MSPTRPPDSPTTAAGLAAALLPTLAKSGPATVVLALFCWKLSDQLSDITGQLSNLTAQLVAVAASCGR